MSSSNGLSLFQGAEPLKINTTLEREEEEERLHDQKRREEELGNLLENAFDDLDDDDDSTVDSTTHFQSEILHQNERKPPIDPQMHQHQGNFQIHQHQNLHPLGDEYHKLNMLLKSKDHELNNMKQIATEASNKWDEYQKRCTIAEAELERALREKQHTHELLVESKEICSNLNNTIEKLRGEKKSLELENTQLVGKLETVQTLLSDVQQKYDMVERDFHKRDDRNAEIRIKQLEEHQRAQTELMQQQLNQMTDQLDKKKQELEQMHTRYHALHSTHETMLVEKAGKINELNNALDIAQQRCNQMAGKPNYEVEYSRQKQCINELQAQITTMEQTISTLTERVNGTTAELDLMDTLLQQHQAEDTPSRLSPAQSRFVGSTPLNTVDRIGNIKNELSRAIESIKYKREQVRKLEKKLEERNTDVRTLREQENKLLVELATLKEEKMHLENRLKLQEKDLNEFRKPSNENKLEELQKQLELFISERDSLQKNCTMHAAERRKIEGQLKNVEVDMEELKQEHESLKRNYEQIAQENRQLSRQSNANELRVELERYKIQLKGAQNEVERLKKLYADISTEKETLAYQLQKLRDTDNVKELQELRDKLASLQRTLQLEEVKSNELNKILEMEKLCHEREIQTLREKMEREKNAEVKASKESATNCSRCLDHLAVITKTEIELLKLSNLNTVQRKELDELAMELKNSKAQQAEMEERLDLMTEQERLIIELKAKASQFEEYIKTHSTEVSASANSTPPQTKLNAESQPTVCVDDDPSKSPALNSSRIKRIEQRVRDEMAKLFAVELKRFTVRLQQTEEKSQCLQREYQLVHNELQQRQTEVEVLKQTILAEREKIQEILAEKDDSYRETVDKQKAMIQKCRNEIHSKTQRIDELVRELDERHAAIESERQSMKTVMTQWEAQRQTVDQVEAEWCRKLDELRETHEAAMRASHLRYQSAKRTAHNYKIYAEDKEAHMKREYERLKQEYELSLAKIELAMNQKLDRKSREPSSRSSLKHQSHDPERRDKENEPSNS